MLFVRGWRIAIVIGLLNEVVQYFKEENTRNKLFKGNQSFLYNKINTITLTSSTLFVSTYRAIDEKFCFMFLSPRLLFSQSRNMLSLSAIKLPISLPYHPRALALALALPSLFACHSLVT